MMRDVSVYRNNETKQVVILVDAAAEELVLNGKTYSLLTAGTEDASKEKHIPALQKTDRVLEVEVGSVTHPMVEKHFIEWIAMVTENHVDIKYLKPGEPPKAVFAADEPGCVYAYCNLHGLWKAEFSV